MSLYRGFLLIPQTLRIDQVSTLASVLSDFGSGRDLAGQGPASQSAYPDNRRKKPIMNRIRNVATFVVSKILKWKFSLPRGEERSPAEGEVLR